MNCKAIEDVKYIDFCEGIRVGESAGEINQNTLAIAIGIEAGQSNQAIRAIAIGNQAGQTNQQSQGIAIEFLSNSGLRAIGIGVAAGQDNQGVNAVAVGNQAGRTNQGSNAIAIGNVAGRTNQGSNAIAIGNQAGQSNQGTNAIAIGNQAGQSNQGTNAIAIGNLAGNTNQGTNAIAIGNQAGQSNQGTNAIAIGNLAGSQQASNSIVISAVDSVVTGATANATYIAPLRIGDITNNTYGLMLYSTSTNEVLYSAAQTSTGNKTFVIDHPVNKDKYLVHACIEGPEVGVYYRGKGEIKDNQSTKITLPHYVNQLAYDFTIQITKIYGGYGTLETSEVENGQFTVYGSNNKFYWHVYGKRSDIQVEPYKSEVKLNGSGPYKWIE
jgi:hypothetical protein